MAESYSKKRVKFLTKSDQVEFFNLLKKEPGLSTEAIASIGKIGVRQVSDWRNAKSTIPLPVFDTLLKISKIPRPTNIQVLDQYSHIPFAAQKAYLATIKKYGRIPKNEKLRKENWEKWWNTIGTHKKHKILERKIVHKPRKSSDLAELCGILIGDGGLTKYQMKITLNGDTDRLYSIFVTKLIKKLFHVDTKLYKVRVGKAVNICVSSTDLVLFLTTLGIKCGNKLKQGLSIPGWIMKSRKYTIACIRGIVDTDGSVIHEIHTVKRKKYRYYRVNLRSASSKLIEQTKQVLEGLGFHPKVRNKGTSVQLENIEEICDYFKRVGTHNPKHIKRLRMGV